MNQGNFEISLYPNQNDKDQWNNQQHMLERMWKKNTHSLGLGGLESGSVMKKSGEKLNLPYGSAKCPKDLTAHFSDTCSAMFMAVLSHSS